MPHIAACITPHGFGHATRTLAILEVLRELLPDLHCHIYSSLPRFLLDQSIAGGYTLHETVCDLGLVQKSALDVDLDATVAQLQDFYPFRKDRLDELARSFAREGCRLVLCDIAPLGLAAAAQAGLPSVLVENFTWSWIYSAYADRHAGLTPFIDFLRRHEAKSDHHFQAAPAGVLTSRAHQVAPVFRPRRLSREQVRRRLAFDDEKKWVLITLGGGPALDLSFLAPLQQYRDVTFLVGGLQRPLGKNLLPLPGASGLYHPDLIGAADLIISKLGYSTVAETFQAGTPFAYVARNLFPESPVLEAFVQKHLSHFGFSETDFQAGNWFDRLPELLALPPELPAARNGAHEIATALAHILV